MPPTRTMATIMLAIWRLFHSFQMKYPMPLCAPTISAATMTNQAIPIEILIPDRIIGTLAGKTTRVTCSNRGRPNTRETFSHSARTEAVPVAVLINIGQTAQMKMMKIVETVLSRNV